MAITIMKKIGTYEHDIKVLRSIEGKYPNIFGYI
jgi:hypothetical protein